MIIYDIIDKKRRKEKLSKEEIEWTVEQFVDGKILNEQMSSLLMAICLNGMTYDETYYLTKAMQNSGKTYHFDFDIVDKHSTGGVSDSTTLILAPLLALAGLKVAKMSGRSLGTTGGTIDKLEVLKGYNFNISEKTFKENIKKVGASIIAQSEEIALADKKIYSLRDKTATVKSIPLIASSIMSKKLACGSKILLLDVKCGNGALMENMHDASQLAEFMVRIGNLNGTKTWAVLTDMNTPLANGIGSALEIYSVVEAINGKDCYLRRVSIELASLIYQMSKNCSYKEAKNIIEKIADNHEAVIKKLCEIINIHGGDSSYITNPNKLLCTKNCIEIKSTKSGFVNSIDALEIAKVVMEVREPAAEDRKHYQGVLLNVQINSKISSGDVLARVYTDGNISDEIKQKIISAIEVSNKRIKEKPLVYKVIK